MHEQGRNEQIPEVRKFANTFEQIPAKRYYMHMVFKSCEATVDYLQKILSTD